MVLYVLNDMRRIFTVVQCTRCMMNTDCYPLSHTVFIVFVVFSMLSFISLSMHAFHGSAFV